jgi:exonuclease SbcC
LSVKEHSLQEINASIQRTKDEQLKAAEAMATAETAVQQQQQQAARYQPDMERARELDTLIGEKEKQLNLSKAASDAAQKRQDDHLRAFEDREKEINTLTDVIGKLHNWQKDHLDRKDIAENDIEIRTQLGHAAKLLPVQQQTIKEQQDNSNFLQKAQEQLHSLQEKADGEQQQLSTLQRDLDAITGLLQTIPVDALKEQHNTLTARIREAEAAKAHWELLSANLKEKEISSRQLDDCRQELQEKTATLQEKQAQLTIAQADKELSDKLLHQARLQVAENVESLRAQLIKDEPCPVCGSKEHPFSTGNPLAHTILKGLEDEYNTALRVYNGLLGDIRSLEQFCKKLQLDSDTFDKTLQERVRQISALELKWGAFSLSVESAAILPAHRTTWLEERVRALQHEQQQTAVKLDTYEEKRKEADLLKNQLHTLQNKLTATRDELKDRQREKASKEEALERIDKQLTNITDSLQILTEQLAPHFNNPVWIENWKKDPQGFDERIRTFSGQWKENVQAITDNTQLLREHQSALHEMSRQGPAIAAELSEKISHLRTQQDQFNALTHERQALLNGEAVAVFEQRLKQTIEQAIAIQQTAVKAFNTRKEDLRAYTVSHEQTVADINNIRSNIEKQSAAIADWLRDYGTTEGWQPSEEELITLLSYSSAWIDTERKTISNIKNAVTTTKATLAERELQVNNHLQKRANERTLEELTLLSNGEKQALEALNKEKSNIDFQLQRDTENKSTIGGLQKNIAAKTAMHENWSKLNELVGSADGKKFRQIAQEYTLDILLGYANMHLAMLTSRYKLLRIPGNLGLQVLDKDMGDELRTVFSLSGGESFLVSLALALGLASLSSSKMKVESLFIDEGFGALDPDTLNVAMDALERLHNQGRKVGVISHVQEMTERIPTQIKVIRMANGKSKVEVAGS